MDDYPTPSLDTDIELPPGLRKLKDEMLAFQEARNIADGAESIEVINPVTGEPVRHLHMRLSAADTKRVMSMPPEQRAAMTEAILAERAALKFQKRDEEAKLKKVRKDRKRKAKARRKNR